MDDSIEKLKKEYMDIEIPVELDLVLKKSLREGKRIMTRKKYIRRALVSAASLALVTSALTVGLNSSEAFAASLSEIPVIRNIVRVLTFKKYELSEDGFNADIKTPSIDGLENKELENALNEKYINENKELYEKFKSDMENLQKNGGGHMGVDSGYVVKTDTEKMLSIGRYVVNTVGSSSTVFRYDTIDKKNEILITLKSLFNDDSYIDVISKNIREQMIEQNKANSSKIYWIEEISSGLPEQFKKISAEQNFYISKENKLVISFDKYEVAPGFMGVVEFVIPTEILNDILVSSEYIK
jgi:hypothetical protein